MSDEAAQRGARCQPRRMRRSMAARQGATRGGGWRDDPSPPRAARRGAQVERRCTSDERTLLIVPTSPGAHERTQAEAASTEPRASTRRPPSPPEARSLPSSRRATAPRTAEPVRLLAHPARPTAPCQSRRRWRESLGRPALSRRLLRNAQGPRACAVRRERCARTVLTSVGVLAAIWACARVGERERARASGGDRAGPHRSLVDLACAGAGRLKLSRTYRGAPPCSLRQYRALEHAAPPAETCSRLFSWSSGQAAAQGIDAH